MKTSVMEVHDMLSVLSVEEVEKRIGEVPGVLSVTVNYAAKNATVRFDETRLDVADIKSAVRQRGQESETPAAPPQGDAHEGHAPPATAPPDAPVAAPVAPATAPMPMPMPAAPDAAPDAGPTAPAGDEKPGPTTPAQS
ncbi:MAG: heavy-metal-associated domain-containing protein [Vicinamibacteria bacterium]